jgi:hypothetical protein
MTFLTGTEAVLPMDSRGRVRVPAARREALLAEFAKSGLCARAFARLIGVHETTFSGWNRRQRKNRDKPAPAPIASRQELPPAIKPLQLLEAMSEAPPTRSWSSGLVIELAGGARVSVTSAGQLPLAAELLDLLAQARSRSC